MSQNNQRRQPIPQQVAANDDYGSISDEDREHIDEVVSIAQLTKGFRSSKPN